MKINVKLLESNSQIRKLILNALMGDVQNTINKSIGIIENKIKQVVLEALRNEPEYASLKGGQLRYELGIPDSTSIDLVVQSLANTFKLIPKPLKITNLGLGGGFQLTMIGRDDVDNISNSDYASVFDTNGGYSLPWLKWLLFEGTKPIVKNYEVKMGPNPNSRTGMAVMVKSNDDWKVPPQFAGTPTSNWITRALSSTEEKISNIIRTTIENNV